ncbi:MAG: gliding motility lipoprotein GldB [Bacteroidota bacterium]|nr:gliding motility lipoprotein GldB [Bacteroidota bacterium]
MLNKTTKLTFLIILIGLIYSCDKKSQLEKQIAAIEVSYEFNRFEQEYYKATNLEEIKLKYPYFFPKYIPDSVWMAQKKDTIYQEVYQEVQKKFANTLELENDLTSLFKHIKYYFPNEQIPKVNTLITEVDYLNKVFYSDTIAIISLDLYLGKDHHFYQAEADYLKQELNSRQILPDLVKSFAFRKVPYPTKADFLSLMIYEGKILYIKDLLLPNYTDNEKINYTQEQLDWVVANQDNIWRYFIDNNMLYDTNPQLAQRFINKAPFSKFYLDIDNQSPGRIATWLGWQIVKSYAKNNNVSLTELLMIDAEELFNKSKYKPTKI